MVVQAREVVQVREAVCRISMAAGRLLVSGRGLFDHGPGGDTLVVMALDAPGTLVQQCLLGPVRDVTITLDEGPPQAAQVERVFFHPTYGRACALRLLPDGTDGGLATG
jgi:hypothetical protein